MLSDGEKIMTLTVVLIQYRSVMDGQTDGHLCSGYTSACIACYANALVKTDNIIVTIISITVNLPSSKTDDIFNFHPCLMQNYDSNSTMTNS